jgi:HD-GYP domain-containing protein (c-di-GMP phosphodiesterase class II)
MKDNLKIDVTELEAGMYVCRLDRPWLGTPYLIEGVLITSQEDIDELTRHSRHVYVDVQRSEARIRDRLIASKSLTRRDAASASTAFHGNEHYTDKCEVEQELPAARDALLLASQLMDNIRSGIRDKLRLDAAAVHHSIEAMRDSVVRNPDALLLLTRLKTMGSHDYEHAVSVAAHLLAFGRHLGLPREELSILGLGGLLMNIGYLGIPPEITGKRGTPTPEEHALLKQHVRLGEEIITQSSGFPDKVALIIGQHHEREDGTGYPLGLHANQIHPYGRMAAIVNSYTKLIFGRPDVAPVTPLTAILELRNLSRWGLNATLVEQFAQCLGLFPVGSLVELNSGEVGIVLSHSRLHRLRPRIMIILDPRKTAYATPTVVDLRTAPSNAGGIQIEIVRALEDGAYDIDPARYYL